MTPAAASANSTGPQSAVVIADGEAGRPGHDGVGARTLVRLHGRSTVTTSGEWI